LATLAIHLLIIALISGNDPEFLFLERMNCI